MRRGSDPLGSFGRPGRTRPGRFLSRAQREFVAPVGDSIAEAHFAGDVAWHRAMYAGEEPVGFVPAGEVDEDGEIEAVLELS
jgi:hypothetical protein